MNVFVTGATGYIGSFIAEKLLQAEHQVASLARSEAAAQILKKQGIEPCYGGLNTPEILTTVARAVDGIIHTAFDRSTGDLLAASAVEANAVKALSLG
jgi:nucleoside-diphosphate-sugar epimerase